MAEIDAKSAKVDPSGATDPATQVSGVPLLLRPGWWNEFLTRVDLLPEKTPPHDLVTSLIDTVDPEWRESGLLVPIISGLHAPLQADDRGAPLRGADRVFEHWETFHDEIVSRGPPEFRARFCDLSWVGRRDHRRAVDGIEAYLEAATACMSAKRMPSAGHYVRRALAICRQLKRVDLDEKARDLGLAIMRDEGTDAFARWVLARTLAESGGEVSREVADLVERLTDEALQSSPSCDWDWLRAATLVAAAARKACGEPDAAARLRLRAAELYVLQGEALATANASRFLIADCYSRATRALRDGGHRDAAEAAHRALLAVQKDARAEMARFSTGRVDLTNEALQAIAAVEGKAFGEQLLILSSLAPRGSVANYREFALASAKQYPLQSMIPFQAVDEHGRRAKSAVDPIERSIIEHASMHRACLVIGAIEPARRQIAVESPGDIHSWVEVLCDRPLVDPARVLTLAKGLAAGLDGDWAVSTCVLIPQIEFLVRRLLGDADELTSTMNADGTQREKLFSELLKRPKLTEILGDDWVFDLTSFLVEPGGNLRNRVAHGMVADAQFNTVEGSYAWFLVIELVMTIGVTRSPSDPAASVSDEEAD